VGDGVDPAVAGGLSFVPLAPVAIDDSEVCTGVEKLVRGNPRRNCTLGLSNISRLETAERFSTAPNTWSFVDFPLYVANRSAYRFFSRAVKKPLFLCYWIEGDEEGFSILSRQRGSDAPLIRVAPTFSPPLFLCVGRFVKHDLYGAECFPDCQGLQNAPGSGEEQVPSRGR
jgi:hypothetical protein